MSATGREGSWLLRTPVIVRLLAALLLAATALLATGVALGAFEAGWGAQTALLIGWMAGNSGSRSCAQRTASRYNQPARAVTRRSQVRTVSAGTPRSAAILRCPAPDCAASNPDTTTCTVSACRGTSSAGSSTCVAAHTEQRPRRGRTVHRVPRSPRTTRERA